MRDNKLKGKELKEAIDKAVKECKKLARKAISEYTPENKDWPTVHGAAYLRVSDDKQVMVEYGSLLQQINIAQVAAKRLSVRHQCNYKITQFYIEPGISGTHDRREEFIKLQQEIKRDAYDFVIFKELSRLARNAKVAMGFLESAINSKCEIYENDEFIDFKDPEKYRYWMARIVDAEVESKRTSKRVKETAYFSLVHSKKFNGAVPRLGLEIKKEDGRSMPGFYQVNEAQMKQVEYIYKTFLKLGSLPATCADLKKKGITNYNGSAFTSSSLKNLLTDMRYIGEWEINKENRGADESKIYPYERYAHIKDFPHGCPLNKDVWRKVQVEIKKLEGSKKKNLKLKRDNV